MNEAVYEFFATCLPGAERLLADELHGLGVKKVRPLSGGASFFGAPEDALRLGRAGPRGLVERRAGERYHLVAPHHAGGRLEGEGCYL